MRSVAENFAAGTFMRNQFLQPRWPVVNVIVGSNDISVGVLSQGRDDLRVRAQVLGKLYCQTVVLKRQDLVWQPSFVLSRYPKDDVVWCH
jgi:hypothetical protein